MRRFIILILLMLLFVKSSCKKEDPIGDPYLEFVSPSDEFVLIDSEESQKEISLKTNRNVLVTYIDSASNNSANWINGYASDLHKGTVNLQILVHKTIIRRAATITVTTIPIDGEDAKQATISILLRQSTIHLSSAGTLIDYFGGAVSGGGFYDAKKIDICGKMDARDIHYMNDYMRLLNEIDLRSVTIVAYTGNAIFGSQTTYPANEIPQHSFSEKNHLTSIILPANLISIGERAFWDSPKLTSVTIPDCLTSIGLGAFSYCTDLASINIPDNVTSIQDETFMFCEKLNSVSFPSGLVSIGEMAFLRCENLQTLFFPNGLKSIGNRAFEYCTGLKSVTLPVGLTSIGENAFIGCSGLSELLLPVGLTSIKQESFQDCSGLKTITFPIGLTSIGARAFFGCNDLKDLYLPDGLINIEHGAFYFCTGLKTVILPSSLTSIGSSAFEYCENIEEITCYSVDPSKIEIVSDLFSDIDKSSCILKVPAVAVENYKNLPVWQEFKNIQAL